VKLNPHVVQGWQLLLGVLSISDCGVIEALARRGVAAADLAAGADFNEPASPPRLAGASADTVPEPGDGRVREADRLGAAIEVEMLASVLLAKDTPLPLAVGLFGDWGSGKSFFMALMYERINELAKLAAEGRPEASPYCGQIRQVRFNAWHYSDSNLWASLADALFDQLARVDELDQAQAKLEELDEARKQVLDARRRRENLEWQVHNLERPNQQSLRAPISAAIFGVRDEPVVANLKTLRDESASEDREPTRSEQTAGTLGSAGKVGAALADTVRLVSALGDITGVAENAGMTLRLFWEEVLHRRRWATMACLVVLLGLAAAVVAAAQWPTGLKVLTFVGALAVGASPALTGALRVVYFAREARDAAQLKLARKQEDLAQAQVDEKSAEQSVLRRQQELSELREPGLRLRQFVHERAASPIYRERLGVISQVRRDFEQLVALISGSQPSKAERPASLEAAVPARLPEVERIILYIDDLDRCSHDKVVDVLQAVHLLLAFKLFVVVVGVDSEWLERSIRLHYDDLLDEPCSYLEKIFQIPFTLRPKTRAGYQHLIEELTANTTASRRAADVGDSILPDRDWRPESISGHVAEAAGIEPSQRSDAEVTTEASNADSSESAIPIATGPPETVAATAAEPGTRAAEPATLPSPEALVISGPERDLLGRLGAVMPTPRATKRLVNIYRMLRVSVLDEELALFMPGSGDEYQAVVLLLGVLIGRDNSAKSVFEGLMAAEDDSDVWQVLEQHDEVYQALKTLRSSISLNRTGPYRRWAPRVSRFSFRLAEVILADETAAYQAGSTRCGAQAQYRDPIARF
jgi:hypothetical protein